MFICMAGMPSSGKSEFVKKFTEITKHKVELVDPKEYLPDDIDTLPEDDQLKWRVASWEVCLKMTKGLFHEPNDTIIILDTAAASDLALNELFTFAKLKGHYIVHVFMVSRASECRDRAGDTWVGMEAATEYASKFKRSVPALRGLSNDHLTIKNTGPEGLKKIEEAANKLEAIADKHV